MNPVVILLFDDELDYFREFQSFFEGTGYFKVEHVPDGRGAIAAIDRFHPSLVIFDMALEADKSDGVVLAHQVRFVERFNRLPIVILTGKLTRSSARMQDEDSGMRNGVFYISKAPSWEKILAKIAWIFANWPPPSPQA